MGGSIFIQVWIVLPEYSEQLSMWGVPSTCTTRTYWILLQTGFKIKSIWLANYKSTTHIHFGNYYIHCKRTWLIWVWCLGDRFLLVTVIITDHWVILLFYLKVCTCRRRYFNWLLLVLAADVTGQHHNLKPLNIVKVRLFRKSGLFTKCLDFSKRFDFLQKVWTFYKKSGLMMLSSHMLGTLFSCCTNILKVYTFHKKYRLFKEKVFTFEKSVLWGKNWKRKLTNDFF